MKGSLFYFNYCYNLRTVFDNSAGRMTKWQSRSLSLFLSFSLSLLSLFLSHHLNNHRFNIS